MGWIYINFTLYFIIHMTEACNISYRQAQLCLRRLDFKLCALYNQKAKKKKIKKSISVSIVNAQKREKKINTRKLCSHLFPAHVVVYMSSIRYGAHEKLRR